MKNNTNQAYLCPLIIGVLLVLVGLAIQIPGGARTTYERLDGESTDYYVFDNKYSAIDEYVGGDAYNYIIGTCLVTGKTAGTMAAKAISMVGGTMCICLGITLRMLQKESSDKVAALDRAEIFNSSETSPNHESEK
ncbi:MAG: hypothetical protein ACI4JC_04260 [Faecalibacterium sp.]